MDTETSYCTNCGKTMDVNADYCIKCGVAKGKIKHYCDQCGAEVTPEQDFCTTCGHQLAADFSFEKGKQAVNKLTSAAVAGSNKVADKISARTGKRVKPAWIAGAGAAIVVIIVVLILLPKGINGSYRYSAMNDTLIFKNGKVSESGTSNTGSYQISGQELKLNLGNYKMTAELAKDKKSFTVTSADGLAGLITGAKYIKVDK